MTKHAIAVALALSLALLLGACASEADPADPGADDSPSTSNTAATDEVTIPAPATPASPPPDPPTTAPEEPAEAVTSCRGDRAVPSVGRTDIDPTGNRRAPGSIDLLSAPMTEIELPGRPMWIVPSFDGADGCEPNWYVALEGGAAVIVSADGAVTDAGPAIDPPVSGPGVIASAYDDLAHFDDPLPDSRVVSFGPWMAALADPTDRYGHGVLGDRIEAAAIEVLNTRTNERTVISIDAPTVIEGISPMFVDLDPGGESMPQLLVTLSNADVGAWLAVYDLDGTVRAESDPIGRGNRWRNQLGAAQTTSDPVYEIVDVRTPHLDGAVEFFRVEGDRLERTASISGYTNHTIGSRNLDLGILVDADADKLAEVVLPTRDLGSLAVIERRGDTATELGRIELGSSLNTNIASQWLFGQAWLAVGTADGRLLVFGDPDLLAQ